MNAFQFICQYIRRHRLQYVLGILTLFFVDYANIFIPKLTGVITDGLTAHSMDWGDVKRNLLYLFLLGLSLAVGRFFWRYFLFGASRSIEKELRNDMFAHLEKMDVAILLNQLVGEYTEKLASRSLSLVMDTHGFEQVYIMADGRHIWRVFDNLLNNICKYAMEGTRVYIDILSQNPQDMNASNAAGLNVDNLDEQKESRYYNQAEAAEIGSDAQDEVNKAAAHVSIVFKNISASQLNISSDELMERFVRGDSSRNTEGSGLGLSIAQSLMKIMGGDMELEVDGDLFKATLRI